MKLSALGMTKPMVITVNASTCHLTSNIIDSVTKRRGRRRPRYRRKFQAKLGLRVKPLPSSLRLYFLPIETLWMTEMHEWILLFKSMLAFHSMKEQWRVKHFEITYLTRIVQNRISSHALLFYTRVMFARKQRRNTDDGRIFRRNNGLFQHSLPMYKTKEGSPRQQHWHGCRPTENVHSKGSDGYLLIPEPPNYMGEGSSPWSEGAGSHGTRLVVWEDNEQTYRTRVRPSRKSSGSYQRTRSFMRVSPPMNSPFWNC